MTDPALSPAILLKAYAAGVFPMSEHRDDPEIFWVDPHLRGVLPLDGFHISRSLARAMRRGGYRATLDRDFEAVLRGCADRPDTWINTPIHSAYMALHHMGHAHSLEIWQDDELTGGVYGVTLGGAFFGESMFSRRRDASKLALAHLTDHLARCGFTLFDTQFITPHLARLGAREIPRATYHALLHDALETNVKITDVPLETDPVQILQRNTHTS
ncbi:leucyl/phenylalanyl-tRNA--protein transferase [uncultured Roseovarius sp.]|uniref:leucyl/phenylalanyl-tRNA--protein transferase n=1 Tax=Roseovarius sp. TaxID=1486281 RepID=UPI0025F460AC|nr:leucyl/phenylalanyl-tRNA--protein transferase [uncultured Roseovarius sp.]